MDLKELHEFITDLWSFMKAHSEMPIEDWSVIFSEAGRLYAKYGTRSHAKHEMIMDAIEILREEDRRHAR